MSVEKDFEVLESERNKTILWIKRIVWTVFIILFCYYFISSAEEKKSLDNFAIWLVPLIILGQWIYFKIQEYPYKKYPYKCHLTLEIRHPKLIDSHAIVNYVRLEKNVRLPYPPTKDIIIGWAKFKIKEITSYGYKFECELESIVIDEPISSLELAEGIFPLIDDYGYRFVFGKYEIETEVKRLIAESKNKKKDAE